MIHSLELRFDSKMLGWKIESNTANFVFIACDRKWISDLMDI